MNRPIFIILLLLQFGCNNQINTNDTGATDTTLKTIDSANTGKSKELSIDYTTEDFKKALEVLPRLDLPYTFSTEGKYDDLKRSEDNLIFNMDYFKPNDQPTSPYKKVYESDSIVGIIYLIPSDITVPYLMIYKKPGFAKVDSLILFASGGVDDCYYEMNTMTLKSDNTMDFYDSLYSCETDDRHAIIESSKEIKIQTKKYKIETNGKIVLMK